MWASLIKPQLHFSCSLYRIEIFRVVEIWILLVLSWSTGGCITSYFKQTFLVQSILNLSSVIFCQNYLCIFKAMLHCFLAFSVALMNSDSLSFVQNAFFSLAKNAFRLIVMIMSLYESLFIRFAGHFGGGILLIWILSWSLFFLTFIFGSAGS